MKKQPQQKKKSVPHNSKGYIVGYAYCTTCGILYCKNEATRKHLQKPCPDDRDV